MHTTLKANMNEIRYNIKPVIRCRYQNLNAEFLACLFLSNGPKGLTPTTTQWQLHVHIKVNNDTPAFGLVKNIFKSFLQGQFHRRFNYINYKQTRDGFNVMYSPVHLHGVGIVGRREIKSVHVQINFTTKNEASDSTLFFDMTRALNYGFTTIMNKVERIAPLVFDVPKCELLKTALPYLRPIALAIDTPENGELMNVLERGVLTQTFRNEQVEKPQNIYFANRNYEDLSLPKFESGPNYKHEVVFLDEIEPSAYLQAGSW